MESTQRIARDQAVHSRLGIQVDQSAGSGAKLRMKVTADMLNAGGVCHGGLLFALADSACAYAVADAGVSPVTVDANITYLRGARLNDEIVATATVIQAGRRLGHCEVKLTLTDGKAVAVFRATCANLPDSTTP